MRVLGAAAVALLVTFACGKESERPAPVTCVGKCGITPGNGTGVSPEGGSGSVGEGGSANSDDPVELTGNVLLLNDDLNFTAGTLFTDQVELRTEDASGRDVKGLWNGSDPFSIAKVKQTSLLWVLATPQTGLASDALPAVEPVSTDDPDAMGRVNVTLALVRASTLEQILDLASVPLTLDSSKAQIILLLKQRVSGAGDPPPIAGVTVTAPGTEGVLYGASGGFSDVATETDASGVVILANVGSAGWPGALVSANFSGARTSGARVPAVTGAVSLVTLTP
jgi:hypothetical protein